MGERARPAEQSSSPESPEQENEKTKKKLNAQKERAEEIRKVAEKEQRKRIRRIIAAKLRQFKERNSTENKEKNKKKSSRDLYERVAQELVKSGQAEVLIQNAETKKSKEQLSYETEILLTQLFQRLNPEAYRAHTDQETQNTTNELHERAIRTLTATLHRLESTPAPAQNDEIKMQIELLKTILQEQGEPEETEPNDPQIEKINEMIKKYDEERETAIDLLEATQNYCEKKAIALERVANWRELRIIKKKIEKEGASANNPQTTEELEAQRQAVLLEQFALLAKTDIRLRPQDGQTDREAKQIFEYLANQEKIQEILEEFGDRMLDSEKAIWQRLQGEGNKISKLQSLLGDDLSGKKVEQVLRELRSNININSEDFELLEILANPEILGRIRMFEGHTPEEARDELEKTGELQRAELEEWRKTASKEERLAAAKEDMMMKLMLLEPHEYTDEDLNITLQQYALAERTEDGKWEYLDTESQETSSPSEKIKALIEEIQQLQAQYLGAEWLLVKMQEEEQQSRNETINFLNAVQKDIDYDESNNEGKEELEGLMEMGLIELQANAAGISIIINGEKAFNNNDTEEKTRINNLLKSLAEKMGTDLDSIKQNGLGATFQKNATSSFDEYFNNKKDPSSQQASPPGISIIITPENQDYEPTRDVLILHETQDYLFDEFVLKSPNSQNKTEEQEAIREIVSRLFDARIDSENPTNLTDLYLSENQDQQETHKRLFDLVKLIEKIIAQAQTDTPPEDNGLNNYIESRAKQAVREELALKLIAHAEEFKDPDQLNKALEKIQKELEEEYNQTDTENNQSRELYTENSTPHIKRNKYKFYKPPPDRVPILGTLGDSTSPINKAMKEEAARGMFVETGHAPPKMRGGKGKGHYTGWPYSDDARPLKIGALIPGLGRVPILGDIPAPFLNRYEVKRAVAARWANSHNPRLRDAARDFMGGDYLGANPAKIFKFINPKMEDEAKTFIPGVIASRRIVEGREKMPVSLQLDIEDMTYTGKAIQWMNQVLAEAGIGDLKRQQYLSRLLGTKFGFDALEKRYKFKKNPEQLRGIHDFQDDVVVKHGLGSTVEDGLDFAIKNFRAAGYRYEYEHHDKKYYNRRFLGQAKITPWIGSAEGFAKLLNPFKYWASGKPKLQVEAETYYKEYVTRSELPAGDAYNYKWIDQVGTKFKEFLDNRDAYVAFATLKDEAAHFANRAITDSQGQFLHPGEDYSLYHMINLIHIAEELNGDGEGAWAVNKTGKTIKLKFRERGKVKTIKIRPGENLVDRHGNLIYKGFKMGEHFDIDNQGYIRQISDDLEMQKYWGRLVGDRLNPHFRYLRLNSQQGMREATRRFGGNDNIDEGFDEENVLLRTDAIKDGLLGIQFKMMEQALKEGVPPDKRYKVDWVDDINNPGKKRELIIFNDQFDYFDPTTRQNRRVDAFRNIGGNEYATDELKAHLDGIIRQIYGPNTAEYNAIQAQYLDPNVNVDKYAMTDLITRLLGTRDTGLDRFFRSLMNFSDDPTWGDIQRGEVPGLQGIPEYELTTLMDTLRGGVAGVFKDRYERAQNFMTQWQFALKTVAQMERLSYEKNNYYKGISQMLSRGSNVWMIGGLVVTAATGGVIPMYVLGAGYLGRILFKPIAVKNHKRWMRRRLQALERFDNLVGAAGVFQKAMQGQLPDEFELKNMRQWTEKITFWLEELGQTKEPEDWYPEDDYVIKKTAELYGKFEDEIDRLAQAA